MTDQTTHGFFSRLSQNIRLTGRFFKARKESQKLSHRRSACEGELQAAYEQLGATAQEANLGVSLPGFGPASLARQAMMQSENDLAGRETAMKSAKEELARQTTGHEARISAAEVEKKTAGIASAEAEKNLHASQKKQASLEAEIVKAKSHLAELAAAAGSTDATGVVTARMTNLQSRLGTLKTQAVAAVQKQRESAGALDAKDRAIRESAAAGQVEQAKFQKALASAEAMAPPDKAAAVQAVHIRQAEQKLAQEQAAATLEADRAKLAEAAQTDRAALAALDAEVSQVEALLRQDQDILAAREIQARLAELEANLQTSRATVADQQVQADQARQAADGKAGLLKQAQQDWAGAKAVADAAVAAATLARSEAQKTTDSAHVLLNEANRRFGKEAYEAGLCSGPAQIPAGKVEQCIAELAEMDNRRIALLSQMDSTRGTARRTVVTLVGLAVLLLAIAAGVIWGVHKLRSSAKPSGDRQAETARPQTPIPNPRQDRTTTPIVSLPASMPAGSLMGGIRPVTLTPQEQEQLCRKHLKTLVSALKVYRLIHENKSPAKLSDLYYEGMVENLSDFICPASGVGIPAADSIDTQGDYVLDTGGDASNIVMREKVPHHGDKVLSVSQADLANPSTSRGDTTRPTVSMPPPPPTTQTAMPREQKEASALFFSALESQRNNRLPEAETLLRKAIDKNPQNAMFHQILGHVLTSQSKWNEAIESFRAAQRLEPNEGTYHGMIAAVMLKAGRRDEAVSEARKMLPFGIREHWIYGELGILPPPASREPDRK